MRILIFICFLAVSYSVNSSPVESPDDADFQIWEEKIRNKRSPDYGGGLGGPLAAGIREHKPDKDQENVTVAPYIPKSNINNTKKCEVVRMRKTEQEVKGSKTSQASKEFDDYVKKYNKHYPTPDAKEKARQKFIHGREHAQNLNGGRCSMEDAQFATTRYADWTTEEFIQKLGGAREESDPTKLPPPFTVTEDQSRFLYKIPRLDWRTYGVIPAVRDQKQCGGCYAFATTDLLSAQERIDNQKFGKGTVEPYSAQYFIDCMPDPLAFACKGGRPYGVLEYMASCSDCVIMVDRCYQYQNRQNGCRKPSLNCQKDLGAKPCLSKQVNLISRREAEAMATLLRWGPVAAVVDLSAAWQFYNGTGIIRDSHCGKKPNHAVLIVGYDYTGDVPYYIVKNSWSEEWGDNGYVRVEAGKNTCGIATAAIVTLTNKEKCKKFKTIQDFVQNPNAKPEIDADGTIGN